MVINDRWSVIGRGNDFVLIESRCLKDAKTGKDKISTKESYHPSLDNVARKLAREESLTLMELNELDRAVEAIKQVGLEIAEALKQAQSQEAVA